MFTWHILASKEAIAVYALILAAVEKKFQFIKPIVKYAESHKGIVRDVEHALEGGLNTFVHSPEAAALKVKIDALEKDVESSDIYKAATAVMHNLSVRVEDLTPETENAVALAISNEVHRLFGKQVTVKSVVGVLNEFKKLAADVAGQNSVKAAQDLVAPVVQPAPQPTQPADPVPAK